MNIGKVPGNVLKRSVVNLIGKGPRTGVDSAVLKQGDEYILSATGVGLVDSEIAPLLAVYKACNNIWAAGGEVQGVEAVFLLSEKTKERVLKELTRKTMQACRKCNTELSGGHTEVTDCINRAVSTVTAVGTTRIKPRDVRDIKPGMDIVMTKWAGLEEAAILIHNSEAYGRMKERFSEYYLDGFGNYEDWLTVMEEAQIASKFSDAVMHDNSDGGVFGSLWDMAEGSGLGFDIDLRAIPLRQEIIEIACLFEMNIYRMKSSGSLLIACEDGEAMVEELLKAEIPAVCIGRFTDNNDKLIRNEDEIRYLERV